MSISSSYQNVNTKVKFKYTLFVNLFIVLYKSNKHCAHITISFRTINIFTKISEPTRLKNNQVGSLKQNKKNSLPNYIGSDREVNRNTTAFLIVRTFNYLIRFTDSFSTSSPSTETDDTALSGEAILSSRASAAFSAICFAFTLIVVIGGSHTSDMR